MRSLRSYLPDTKPMDARMIIRVPSELMEQVKIIAYRHKWTYSEVVRAGLQKFIDEEKPEPKEGFKLKQMDMFPEELGKGEPKFGSRIK